MVNEKATPVEQQISELQRASADLKARIEEQRLKRDMPINSSLGNPQTDARNADGRNDLNEQDDD